MSDRVILVVFPNELKLSFLAQSPTKRSTTPSTTFFFLGGGGVEVGVGAIVWSVQQQSLKVNDIWWMRHIIKRQKCSLTQTNEQHCKESIREHFAGQRSISKFAKYGCFTFVHHLTYRVCRITGYFNISFLNKMEYVFVMTNDVEIRGVSLSTRIYHEIPIKNFTYKKWNKMGPLCVLKVFESNSLKKKKKYEKGCEEEK